MRRERVTEPLARVEVNVDHVVRNMLRRRGLLQLDLRRDNELPEAQGEIVKQRPRRNRLVHCETATAPLRITLVNRNVKVGAFRIAKERHVADRAGDDVTVEAALAGGGGRHVADFDGGFPAADRLGPVGVRGLVEVDRAHVSSLSVSADVPARALHKCEPLNAISRMSRYLLESRVYRVLKMVVWLVFDVVTEATFV